MTETQKLSMVFIHIPKCGGTSVRQALIEAGYDSGRMGHDTMKNALKYRSDIKEFIVQVREPASRIVSAYNFMHRQLLDFPERLPWLEKYTNMELNDWIRLLLLDEDVPNLEKRKPLKKDSFKGQDRASMRRDAAKDKRAAARLKRSSSVPVDTSNSAQGFSFGTAPSAAQPAAQPPSQDPMFIGQ